MADAKRTTSYFLGPTYWYAICFVPGGPRFKSRQGRELLILSKKEFNNLNLNTIIVWVYESGSWLTMAAHLYAPNIAKLGVYNL